MKLTDGTALAEDAAGRLVAAWYSDGKMLAAASRDGGVHWTRPHVIGTDLPTPDRMHAALGPDGRGWLVYSINSVSQIRVIALNARALLGPKHPPRRHRHPRSGQPGATVPGRHPRPPKPKPPHAPNPGPKG